MTRILILTIHHMKPVHPRISCEMKVLQEIGYNVDFMSLNDVVLDSLSTNKIFRGLFFNPFFTKKALKKVQTVADKYDYFIFYDLHLLNVAYQFKKCYRNKTVLYETIDDNLSLYLYANFKRFSFFSKIEKVGLRLLRPLELKKAFYLDEIIVNSTGLMKLFGNRATLLYYTSIFNNHSLKQNPENPIGAIYLGNLTEDKGGSDVLALSNNYNLPVFVFGNVAPSVYEKLKDNKNIVCFGYMNSQQILERLNEIVKEYFLFGISLIHSVHNSYKIQIANKEIDYVALGIPILGNDRMPTKELIEEGYGVFIEDFTMDMSIELRRKLIKNTTRCTKFNRKNYTKTIEKLFLC